LKQDKTSKNSYSFVFAGFSLVFLNRREAVKNLHAVRTALHVFFFILIAIRIRHHPV